MRHYRRIAQGDTATFNDMDMFIEHSQSDAHSVPANRPRRVARGDPLVDRRRSRLPFAPAMRGCATFSLAAASIIPAFAAGARTGTSHGDPALKRAPARTRNNAFNDEKACPHHR